jgi:cytochrome c553
MLSSPTAERISRDGTRNNAVMKPIPAARSDTDTADLAAYYAAQLCP